MRALVTGAAGFIGSALVRRLLSEGLDRVISLDCLSYAGTKQNLSECLAEPGHEFIEANICDSVAVRAILDKHEPNHIYHLAAESHVDRSISSARPFVESNIVGTFTLLEAVQDYLIHLSGTHRTDFRFIHVSTDEVYGTLDVNCPPFSEASPYDPRSPYAATKASSDHMVSAWINTHEFPAIITHCSNNYGPRQFPEKLIPVVIQAALRGHKIPVYGNGLNVRDWIYVEDHVDALWRIACDGRLGEVYNIGGENELSNIDLVRKLCAILDELYSDSPYCPHESLIDFVRDRPGHDFRYSIDNSKISKELGWSPASNFDDTLLSTVSWFGEKMQTLKDTQT